MVKSGLDVCHPLVFQSFLCDASCTDSMTRKAPTSRVSGAHSSDTTMPSFYSIHLQPVPPCGPSGVSISVVLPHVQAGNAPSYPGQFGVRGSAQAGWHGYWRDPPRLPHGAQRCVAATCMHAPCKCLFQEHLLPVWMPASSTTHFPRWASIGLSPDLAFLLNHIAVDTQGAAGVF